jgi:hypothetical protein
MYQFCDEEWSSWEYQDTGINRTQLSEQMEQLAYKETDFDTVTEGIMNFTEIYMDKLLYNYPLLASSKYDTFPKDLDVSKVKVMNGLFPNWLFTGAGWSNQKDSFARYFPECGNEPCNLDYLQFTSTSAYQRARLLTSNMILLDQNLQPRPGLAKQWEMSDWDIYGNGSNIIENGKNKFWIRDDAYYIRNTYNGPEELPGGPYTVQPEDLIFTQYLDDRLNNHQGINMVDWEVNHTENSVTFYGSQTNLNTPTNFGFIVPTPTFLLNKTLTYNSTFSATPYELLELGLSPYDTREWDDYEVDPVTAGPYYLSEYVYNNYSRFSLRDDYWYPNEWDSPNHDFVKHDDKIIEPYYFTYNATENKPFQKPTKLNIVNYEFKIIDTEKYGTGSLAAFKAREEAYLNHEIDVLDLSGRK